MPEVGAPQGAMLIECTMPHGVVVTTEVREGVCQDCVQHADAAPGRGRSISLCTPRPPTDAELALVAERVAMLRGLGL